MLQVQENISITKAINQLHNYNITKLELGFINLIVERSLTICLLEKRYKNLKANQIQTSKTSKFTLLSYMLPILRLISKACTIKYYRYGLLSKLVCLFKQVYNRCVCPLKLTGNRKDTCKLQSLSIFCKL